MAAPARDLVPRTGAFLGAEYADAAFNALPSQELGWRLRDMDGDGDADLIRGSSAGFLLMRNDGSPRVARWSVPVQLRPASAVDYPLSFDTPDLNSDGVPDLIYRNGGADLSVLFVAGTRAPGGDVSFPGTPVPCVGVDWPALGSLTSPSLVMHDLDRDGRKDLLALYAVTAPGGSDLRVNWWRRSGDALPPAFEAGAQVYSFAANGTNLNSAVVTLGSLEIMDGNGDGVEDLFLQARWGIASAAREGLFCAAGSGVPAVWGAPVFGGVGGGQTGSLRPLPGIMRPFALSDLDGDGDVDALSSLGFSLNRGTRTAMEWAPADETRPAIRGGRSLSTVVRDMDGDGDLDLLICCRGVISNFYRVMAFENRGSPVTAVLNLRPEWTAALDNFTSIDVCMDAMDLDGDGDLDLMFNGPGFRGYSLLTLSPAGPVFGPALAAPAAWNLPANSMAQFSLADVNGDGLPDYLAVENGMQVVGAYLNQGTAAQPVFGAVTTDFFDTAANALPGVSILGPKFVTWAGGANTSAFYVTASTGLIPQYKVFEKRRNTGGHWSDAMELLSLPHNPHHIEVADWTGDGEPDLLVGLTSGGVLRYDTAPAPGLPAVNSQTLPSGAARTFFEPQPGPPLAFSFIANTSGATLQPDGSYQAGVRGLDVIEARDASNRVTRAYINVIPAAEAAAFGKAILIAGAKGLTDPAWPATDRMSRKAYDALRLRGYSKENIHFLSFEPGRDLDGNGLNDDIDGPATMAAATDAFTTFATNATRLVVGLWDHGAASGSGDVMLLNPSETLSATQLDAWLDAWQTEGADRQCGVILEFCNAGAFLDDLAGTGTNRIVAASCATNQLAYFIAQGLVSFTESFFSGVTQGLDFGACFQLARDGMDAYQNAQLDDNGDGVFNPDQDGTAASAFSFGASYSAGRDVPQIGRISPNQDVSGSDTVTLWAADIASPNAIVRVWAVVVPPTHQPDPALANPVTDLPEIDLIYNPNTGRYEGDFQAFTEPGSYAVIYFARDVWGGVSVPRQSYITQSGLRERVILVGGQTDDPVIAAGIQDATRRAYSTLRARRIAAEDIRWLSASAFEDTDGDTTNDVFAAVSSTALQDAVQNWSAGVDRLTLLILAEGTNNQARLAGQADLLGAATLRGWLDTAAVTNQITQVMLDFSGSGAFVPVLNPAPVGQRLVMASTGAGRFSVIEPGISLTSVVMSEIFSGRSVGAAVSSGRKIMRRMSGALRQHALLDSDGDGVPNEKNIDDPVARAKYLGAGFVTGDDSPVIGRVTPDVLGGVATPLVLFAESIVDADGIASVWAEIAGPESEPGAATRRVDLLPDGPGRWAAIDAGMVATGLHSVAFFAEDTLGNRSAPVVARVERVSLATASPPDHHEDDDDPLLARIADLPLVEIHTLHLVSDEDWIRFYASSSLVYDIATSHLTNTLDTVLEIYSQSTGGVLTLIDRVDDFGADEGEWTGLDFPADGIYAVRVTHASGEPFAPGAYELSITVPAGLLNGISVYVVDALGSPSYIPGATVHFRNTSGGLLATRTSSAYGLAEFQTPRGNYQVEVVPPVGAGFLPYLGDGTQSFSVSSGEFKSDSVTRFLGVSRSALFFKAATVTGRVETVIPGEAIGGALVRMLTPGGSYTRYPATTAGTPWVSGADGSFPATVVVPAASGYSAEISAQGYLPRSTAVGTLAPGETRDLGPLALTAADMNNNQVPDPWEYHWFNGLVDVSLDPDLDRSTHFQEYVAGTDPTNTSSVLRVLPGTNAGPFRLVWQPSAGRRYRIFRMTSFPSGVWQEQHVSHVAGASPSVMEWVDPAPPADAVYRIDAELP